MKTTCLRERDTISPTIPPGEQETATSKLTLGRSRDVETKRRAGLLQCGRDFLEISFRMLLGPAPRWAQSDFGCSCKTRGKRFSRLSTTPVMPSGRLASARITAECMVFNDMGTFGQMLRSSRAASRPFMRGMDRSRMIRSGLSSGLVRPHSGRRRLRRKVRSQTLPIEREFRFERKDYRQQ